MGGAARGRDLMMIGMLVAGIGCVLAGLVAIGFGIPINEFGLGNTLILAGAVTACSGLLILSLWVVVKELKGIAGRLGAVPAHTRGEALQPALPRSAGTEVGSPALGADEIGDDRSGGPPPPWAEETVARDRPRQEASLQPPPEPPAKPRRNLMFSSSARRERERTQARTGDAPVAEPRPAGGPVMETDEVPPANFDDAWPKSERARPADGPPQRRVARAPSSFTDTAAARQPPPVEGQPPVTVLKSGVVDGMAYSLYSDGSIEAQMPEGMMRFASIDELRAHLDQRP